MPENLLRLKPPVYFNLEKTALSHGWSSLSPFSYTKNPFTLSFVMEADGSAVDIRLVQKPKSLEAVLASSKEPDTKTIGKIRTGIIRSLGLSMDTSELKEIAGMVDPEFEAMVENGAGRLLRSPTLWEDAAKTLFTTNCTFSLTRKMAAALCGISEATPSPTNQKSFPGPETILKIPVKELKRIAPLGYRAPYLQSLADRFLNDGDVMNMKIHSMDYMSNYKLIKSFKGFGDYAARHLTLLMGHYGKIPVDSIVTAYFRDEHGVEDPEAFIETRYAGWGHYRWWGFYFEIEQHEKTTA